MSGVAAGFLATDVMQLMVSRHRADRLLIRDAMDPENISVDRHLTVTSDVLRTPPEATLAHGRGVREHVAGHRLFTASLAVPVRVRAIASSTPIARREEGLGRLEIAAL